MATIELKEELHRKIDSMSNVSELLDIKYSIDWFLSDNLTWEEKEVLKRIAQISDLVDQQAGILHSDVMKESKKWLRKQ